MAKRKRPRLDEPTEATRRVKFALSALRAQPRSNKVSACARLFDLEDVLRFYGSECDPTIAGDAAKYASQVRAELIPKAESGEAVG